jgi:hypothetical protein
VDPQRPTLSEESEARFFEGLAQTSRFLMGTADVQKALLALAATLEKDGIPYAIVGAMALNEYGYVRATADVDVLLTAEGLAEFKRRHLGRGYVEKFPGSKGMRDTDTAVGIDVRVAGEFPGDGQPKAVAFPDPAKAAERGKRVALLPLPGLVELKLASGISAPHRLKDLADVLELIKAAGLPANLAEKLDPSVRAKYGELWSAAQVREPE